MNSKAMYAGGASLALCAILAGCQSIPSVGPNYAEPTFDVPERALPDAGEATSNLTATCEYKTADAAHDRRVVISQKELAEWWKHFNDPVLDQIVDSAVSNNASYHMALMRLEQSNWQLLGTYSAFLPHARLDAGWTHNVNREHNSDSYRSQTESTGNTSFRSRTWNLGATFNWEIDIFGGSRRNTEAAIAQAEAAGWTVADAWLSLTTQIGITYINLRTCQEHLVVARTNLRLQSETYDILHSRLSSGIGDELAVSQCAYIVEETRAQIPLLLAEEQSLKNRLAILGGHMPGAYEDLLKPVTGRDWLLAPQRVAALPLNLIRSRPDVKVAERNLAAQTARIGVARAQWYPRLFITGLVGVQSSRDNDVFDFKSLLTSFGPAVSWPIFQAGAIYSQVKAEEAKTQESVMAYRLAIENAYADVRDSYSAYTQEYHRYKSLKSAVKAATDAVTISQDLYKNGLRDFNNVLDAQRSRLDLEEKLTTSRGSISTDLIRLYRALGGGLATAEEDEDGDVEDKPAAPKKS